jgi:hypothetical protein
MFLMAFGIANHNGENFHVMIDNLPANPTTSTDVTATIVVPLTGINVSQYSDYTLLISGTAGTTIEISLSGDQVTFFTDGTVTIPASGSFATKPSYLSVFVLLTPSAPLTAVQLQGKLA